MVGPDLSIIDSATTTAKAVRQKLADHGLLRQDDPQATVHFLASDSTERFALAGGLFLGHSLSARDVEHVNL